MARAPRDGGEGGGATARLGGLFGETLAVLRRQWFWYLAIVVVLGGPTELARWLLEKQFPADPGQPFGLATLLSNGVFLITAAIGLGMLSRLVLDDQAGWRIVWWRVLEAPWRRFLPLMAAQAAMQSVSILLDLSGLAQSYPSFGLFGGTFIGAISMAVWSTAAVVATAEDGGPWRTLSRAAYLTSNRRPAIYGYCIFWMLAVYLIPIALMDAALSTFAAPSLRDGSPWQGVLLVGRLAVVQLLNWSYDVSQVLLYLRLTRIKDGLGPGEAGDVFD